MTIFLDLVELGSSNATSILSSLMHCLNCHCFSEQFICDYLVGIATDGASAMLGRKAGVCKLLSDKRPGIVVWHCLAHRLELTVHDTIADVSGINHLKSFLDKLYCLYSSSPKN